MLNNALEKEFIRLFSNFLRKSKKFIFPKKSKKFQKTSTDMERTIYELFFGERIFPKYSAVFEIKIPSTEKSRKIKKINFLFLN